MFSGKPIRSIFLQSTGIKVLWLLALILWPRLSFGDCPKFFAKLFRDSLHTVVVRPTLNLRYKVTLEGLDAVKAKGTQGILFLPNHPALIDPFILSNQLNPSFHPRPAMIASRAQDTAGKFTAWVQNAFLIPDISQMRQGPGTPKERREAFVQKMEGTLDDMVTALKNGENLVIYPAGQLTPGDGVEVIGAKGAVEAILAKYPDVRIVLVDTKGLRGSSFGLGKDNVYPVFIDKAVQGIKSTLGNGVFFNPKRDVTMSFTEPADFPRGGDKTVINTYLEDFWKKNHPEPRRSIPYSLWGRQGSTATETPE